MKRKVINWFIILSLLTMNLYSIAPVQAASGNGTTANPFIITTCIELQNMKNNLSASYALGNNIDCSDTVNWNGGKGFEPVGNGTNKFTGSFDGRGYTISGLTINRPNELYLGLIGYAEGVNILIQNVTLSNIDVRSDMGFAGTLVGYAYTGVTMKNIKILNANVISGDYVGGLTAYFRGTLVDNVYVSGYIEGDTRVGGILSTLSGANGGTLSHATFNGALKGTTSIGGLIGYTLSNVTVRESSATGTIEGMSSISSGQIGGLIGTFKATAMSNSYSRMGVTCSVCTTSVGAVGGMIGYMESGSVDKSYSTGQVSTNVTSKGGLIGTYVAGTVTNSYWDKTTSGMTTTGGNKGTGKTTTEMKTQATFTGWDFSKVWILSAASNNGYPSFYREVLNVNETDTASTVSLTWDNPVDITFSSVNIYRNGVKIGQTNSSTYQDSGLGSDIAYNYTLKTVDIYGKESPGILKTVTTYDNIPPSAVTSLTAIEKNDGVYLNWSNPPESDVQKIIVKRNGTTIYTGLASSFIDKGTTEKTYYTYTLQALDENNNASPSASASITTLDKTPPQEVADFQGIDESDGIYLSWNNPSDNDFDHVRILKDNVLLSDEVKVYEFKDTAVTEKTTYTYTIQTVDNANNVSNGISISMYVKDKTPPSPVSNLQAIEEENSIHLTWVNPSDDDIDHISILKDGVLLQDVNGTLFIDNDIEEKTTYSYQLIVYDAAGNASSAVNTSITTLDKTSPASVSNLIAIENAKEVHLSWELPSDDDIKEVILYRNGLEVYRGTESFYNDSDVEYSTIYTYNIVVVDTSDNSSPLNSVFITTSDRPPLENITNVQVNEDDNGVMLKWTKPLDERFSKVLVYRDGQLLGQNALTSWYLDTTTTPYQSYTYKLVTIDVNGNTLAPIAINFKTKDKAPASVQKVKATFDTSVVQLKWEYTTLPLPKSYIIYRNGMFLTQTNNFFYQDKNVELGRVYVYKVLAISETGLFSKDETASVTTPVPPLSPPPPTPPVIVPTNPDPAPTSSNPFIPIPSDPAPSLPTSPVPPEEENQVVSPSPVFISDKPKSPLPETKPNTLETNKKEKSLPKEIKHSVVLKKSEKGFVLTWTAPEDVEKVLIYRNNVLIGETTKERFEDILKKTKGTVTYKLVFVRANGKKMSTTIKAKVEDLAKEVAVRASLKDSRLSSEKMWDALIPSAGLMVIFVGAAIFVVRRKGI
ncbi:hypothetical protein CN918_31340 [Priestia megaterium]|nr:hypothetical protein CN918_31340 [Priestia megaterium]